MGQLCTVSFKDVNGEGALTRFWVNDTLTAVGAIQHLANLSNAAIVSAFTTKEADITSLQNNDAVSANNESVRTKALIIMSGPDGASAGNQIPKVRVSIPAPLGSIISGDENADGFGPVPQSFVGLVVSNSGVVMTAVNKVFYEK